MTTAAPHIFISYARADGRDYANRVADALCAAGYAIWLDTRSIDENQDFSVEIEANIRAASHVVACICAGEPAPTPCATAPAC